MSITEYFTLQKKYEAQYGPRTVVLYQSGTFYETWEYDPADCKDDKYKIDKDGNFWNEHIGKSVSLSTTLNYNISCESYGEPYSIKNPNKLGFPTISYEKNLATLLANDYVVVRVDQQKDGKIITRSVTEICSPTMQIDTISLDRPTSNIACIYIEYQKGVAGKYENFLITTGISVIDIITGNNKVCEFHSKADDQIHAIQELYRFLISHTPRELIIHVTDLPKGLDTHTDDNPNPYIKYLEKVLELRRLDRMNCYINSVPNDYKKHAYQVEFLNKIFNRNTESMKKLQKGSKLNIIRKQNTKIIEELGLERMNYGLLSYMLLLKHCNTYNSTIISKLAKPNLQWLDEGRHLILTHNAIVQLDLIPQKENKFRTKSQIDSVLSVLDHCRTHLGRRSLENLLQNPMLKPDEINIFYNMINEMYLIVGDGKDPLWFVLSRQLKELPDIGRIQRKLELKLITPRELAILYRAYLKIVDIYVIICGVQAPTIHSQLFSPEEIESFNLFLSRFGSMLNVDALECCHIDSGESGSRWLEFVDCPIREGTYSDLDTMNVNLITAENHLQLIVDHLNSFLTKSVGKRIEFKSAKRKQGAQKQDPTNLIILTTNAKATTLANSNINVGLCGNLQFNSHSTAEKSITSEVISYLCTTIDNLKYHMRKKLLEIYEDILEEMTTKFNFYLSVINLISKIDLVHCYASVSHKYNYHRPEIVDVEGPSFLEARDLRHPIIERIIDYPYVTNDVFLGCNENNTQKHPKGMLLYGINACGKSSMLKAVALNIIMAQAGCYTPSLLRYKPYSKIITRLSGNDNIFKGESTFIVEASELRTIARQSDQNSLVLCDECSSGSESSSASAITVALIRSNLKCNNSFMISTHMHSIIEFPQIIELSESELNICHLTVERDPVTNTLIYDRKLKPGNGETIYGITVLESLGFPDSFLRDCHEVLSYLDGHTNNIVDFKKSNFSSKVYMTECAVCQKTNLQTKLNTHHIIEQNKADARGLIQNFHKNIKDNLIVLCEDCHNNLHKQGLELETLQSSDGTIVRVK
jgi:DNA mismatch repair protein MutS